MKKVIIVILVIVVAFCYLVTRDDNKQCAPVYNAPAYNRNVNYVPNPVYPDYNSLDNSDTTVVQQPQQQICPVCHGSGACPICHGTGTVSYYGDRTGCSACTNLLYHAMYAVMSAFARSAAVACCWALAGDAKWKSIAVKHNPMILRTLPPGEFCLGRDPRIFGSREPARTRPISCCRLSG